MAKRSPASRLASPPPPLLPGRGVRNLLLAALPANEFQRIAPTLEVLPLELKQVLHKPGVPIEHVYFPGGGFCSVLTVLEDGRMVEVLTIGREGMLGSSASVGDNLAPSLTMVQGATNLCYRLTVDAFRRELDRRGRLCELVTRFTDAQLAFVMQSTACNAVHSVEQRLARWLLMAQDRMESSDFPLTQELAAMMLGASRQMVTVVAGTLQKDGLITYRRGHVTVLDRVRLETASCECYRTATRLLRAVIHQPRAPIAEGHS